MAAKNDVAIYGQGLFNSTDQTENDRQCTLLSNSRFNTLMLFALHVWPEGEIYWGSQPMVIDGKIIYDGNPALADLLGTLRSNGGFNRIQCTIGSADAADWAHIEELLKNPAGRDELKASFTTIARWLSLDGFDFDYEYDEGVNVELSTIATMTGMLAPMTKAGMITWSVFDHRDWWIECLRLVYKRYGRQLVQKLNLQTYAGVDVQAWLDALKEHAHEIGVADPAAFLVPGYAAFNASDHSGDEPGRICKDLTGLAAEGVNSAFVWNTGIIFDSKFTPEQYGSAILAGLNGKPCTG